MAIDRISRVHCGNNIQIVGDAEKFVRVRKTHPHPRIVCCAARYYPLAGLDERDEFSENLCHVRAIDFVDKQRELLGWSAMCLFAEQQERSLSKHHGKAASVFVPYRTQPAHEVLVCVTGMKRDKRKLFTFVEGGLLSTLHLKCLARTGRAIED